MPRHHLCRRVYPDVFGVFRALRDGGVPIAIASASPAAATAARLLRGFGLAALGVRHSEVRDKGRTERGKASTHLGKTLGDERKGGRYAAVSPG